VTPVELFDQVIPKLLQAQRDQCVRLGGVYAVKLGRDGTWTIDFSSASIGKGIKKRPDLTIEMSAADFALMMDGALDVASSLKSGRVKLHGDARKIVNLAAILGAGLG
jgi:hypothetical protein